MADYIDPNEPGEIEMNEIPPEQYAPTDDYINDDDQDPSHITKMKLVLQHLKGVKHLG